MLQALLQRNKAGDNIHLDAVMKLIAYLFYTSVSVSRKTY